MVQGDGRSVARLWIRVRQPAGGIPAGGQSSASTHPVESISLCRLYEETIFFCVGAKFAPHSGIESSQSISRTSGGLTQ